jgi:hypothetical protein
MPYAPAVMTFETLAVERRRELRITRQIAFHGGEVIREEVRRLMGVAIRMTDSGAVRSGAEAALT